jgi:hypothetical protein
MKNGRASRKTNAKTRTITANEVAATIVMTLCARASAIRARFRDDVPGEKLERIEKIVRFSRSPLRGPES